MAKRLCILLLIFLLPAPAVAQESLSWLRDLPQWFETKLRYSNHEPTDAARDPASFNDARLGSMRGRHYIIREQLHHPIYSFDIPLLSDSSGSGVGRSADGKAPPDGLSARYAFVKEQAGQPSLASIRAQYAGAQEDGILDISSHSLELSFARPDGKLTPYWGVGQVWVSAMPEKIGTDETQQARLTKRYIGLSLANDDRQAAFELDQTDGDITFGARFSFRF